MLRYTVLRLLVFAVFLLIFLWLNVPGIWALLFAALFSMVTSLFLLRAQRQQMADQLVEGIERRRAKRAEKIASQRTDEDDEDREIDGDR
ncbi:MAG: DUF4229 domain-containing protein [Ornithinimicrobium sp.]